MRYSLKSIKSFLKDVNEEQTDPELMDKIEDEDNDLAGCCPRCGEYGSTCVCQERDPFSTVNIFRVSKEKEKEKDKSNKGEKQ